MSMIVVSHFGAALPTLGSVLVKTTLQVTVLFSATEIFVAVFRVFTVT